LNFADCQVAESIILAKTAFSPSFYLAQAEKTEYITETENELEKCGIVYEERYNKTGETV